MKLLYIVPVVLLVIFLIYRISKNYGSGALPPLPVRFDSYQFLDEIETIQSGSSKMSLFLESKNNIEFFLTPENYLVIYSMPTEKQNQFTKIDTNGNMTDTLIIFSKPEDLIFLKGFIIDKKTKRYYNWCFTGSKEPVKLITQNIDFRADAHEQDTQLKEILKNSKAIHLDFNFDSPAAKKQVGTGLTTVQGINSYAVVTYFIGTEGFELFTQLSVHKFFPSSFLAEMAWNNVFRRLTAKNRFEGEIIKSSNIVYQHFQKQKIEKVSFSGGGGNAPGFSKQLYPGSLFTNIVFRTDTFKVKEFMYLDEEWNTSAIEIAGKNIGALSKNKSQPVENINGYQYFTTASLHYALFTNNDKKLYLIR